MVKKSILVITLIILISYQLYSQKEFNNWCSLYSNNISFCTPDGIPIKTGSCKIFNKLSSAVASNSGGELLFYTDGESVWNNRHRTMQNGDSLKQFLNHIQNVVIVPFPGDTNKFYIFSSSYAVLIPLDTAKSLTYSIVDMEKNNGFGEVIVRNQQMKTNSGVGIMTTVKHRNKTDYWLVVKDVFKPFYCSFLISSKGIEGPIISIVPELDYKGISYQHEEMKVSPKGTLLATSYSETGSLLLYDFDNSTGELSNRKQINLKGYSKSSFSSIEFSSDGSKLYYMATDTFQNQNHLLQIDLNNVSKQPAIIATDCDGYLMRGPDSKIYIAKYNLKSNVKSIDVILKPNEAGINCKYRQNYILGVDNSHDLSFPNVFYPRKFIKANPYDSIILCEGDTLKLLSKINVAVPNVAVIQWNGPNGFISNEENPIIPNSTPPISGTYKYVASYMDDIDSGVVNVTINNAPNLKFSTGKLVSICEGKYADIKVYSDSNIVSIKWSNGVNGDSIRVREAGFYSVTLSNIHGCSSTDSVEVKVNPVPKAEITPAYQLINPGDNIELKGKPDACTYNWSTGETTQNITVNKAGRYFLIVSNANGCFSKAISCIGYPKVFKSKIVAIGSNPSCEGESIILKAQMTGSQFKYFWSTGDTTETTIVDQEGMYYLTQTSDPDSISVDSVFVRFLPNPKPNIMGAPVICNSQPTVLSADTVYDKYSWSTGDTSKSIIVTKPGIYVLTVMSKFGCSGKDTVYVSSHKDSISNVNDIAMDSICLNNVMIKEVTWVNNGDSTEIKSIHFKDAKNFTLLSPKKFPLLLTPGQQLNLKLMFTPTELKEYSDSIICEIENPCTKTYNAQISGCGIAMVKLIIDSKTANVGENVCIPLSVVSLCNIDTIIYLEYYVNLSYPIDVLNLVSLKGVAKGTKYIIDTVYKNVPLTNKKVKIDEFCGSVVLASEDNNTFAIDKAYNLSPYLIIDTLSGILSIKGLCQRDLLRIKKFVRTQFSIISSNDIADIEIQTEEAGDFNLSVYSIEGIKQQEVSWSKNNIELENKNVNLKLDNLASGVYFVVLKTERSLVSKTLVIY